MTNLTLKIFGILLMACMSVQAQADNGEQLNITDDQGNRQGYWIIKGYMTENASYSSNLTVEEGEYINNKKEGVWKHYFPSGSLHSEITYINNRPEGEYTIFYENGVIEEKSSWKKNKNVGPFVRNHPNGNPHQEFFFSDNGLRNGLQLYYHENGNLELQVEIVNGKENGELVRYFADGKVQERKIMKDGEVEKQLVALKRPTKTIKKEITIEAHPVEEKPSEVVNDKPNEAFSFKPNGYNILYDSNRQITQIGTFRNGRLWDGKWNRYNNDGILVKIEIYKNGQFVGSGIIED